MNRDEYLENALEQWRLWGPEKISCEQIKPIMELMLYHTKTAISGGGVRELRQEEEIRIGIRRFFIACRKRYMELNDGAEDKGSDNRCSINNSH